MVPCVSEQGDARKADAWFDEPLKRRYCSLSRRNHTVNNAELPINLTGQRPRACYILLTTSMTSFYFRLNFLKEEYTRNPPPYLLQATTALAIPPPVITSHSSLVLQIKERNSNSSTNRSSNGTGNVARGRGSGSVVVKCRFNGFNDFPFILIRRALPLTSS